ncbi:hypothetical protein RB597_003022 [Gaeumannomyces tritici]
MPADIIDDAIVAEQVRATAQAEVAAPGDEKTGGAAGLHPTEEELQTLRRVADRIPLKLFTIAFIELCERFSYYGVVIVFTNFIQQPLPAGSLTGAGFGSPTGQSGVLGMGQQASTGITTFNQFYQYMMPLLGAWIADEYWGRYKTICVALGVAIFGHVVLILSAIPPVIARGPSDSLAAMIMGILIIGFGTGGFKPNISPLIVEQLDLDHMVVRTLKSGERVIVDPTITINRVYNWFYFFINIGALLGQLTMVYAELYVGFWLSYLMPTIMLSICPLVMWWGRKHYRDRPPAGSVLGKALKTFGLAQRGRWHVLPWVTYQRMNDGTFWESVKPSKFAPGTKPAWMTFDDAWVDELRRGFAACSVLFWFPLYWLTYNQLNNNLISQAAVMRLDGVPNDVVTNLDPLALLIFIPICDFGLYPLLRKYRIKFTPIKRIAAGFFCGAAAMVWAAVIQNHIYATSECGYNASGTKDDGTTCAPISLTVWAQTGAYVLLALSEIFASITSLDYAFSKAPKNMRSMVQAISLFTTSLSAALGEAFVPLSADPLLVWNYGVVAVLAAVGGLLFWLNFKSLDAEEDALNELPEGKMFVTDEESVNHSPTPPEKS